MNSEFWDLGWVEKGVPFEDGLHCFCYELKPEMVILFDSSLSLSSLESWQSRYFKDLGIKVRTTWNYI